MRCWELMASRKQTQFALRVWPLVGLPQSNLYGQYNLNLDFCCFCLFFNSWVGKEDGFKGVKFNQNTACKILK